MIKTDVRRWVAVWWRCPLCGRETGDTMTTPYRYRNQPAHECYSYKHERCAMTIVERRWYTTFCIEPGISSTTIAGTLEKIGPFQVCNIVHPNRTKFRQFVRRRQAEMAKQRAEYLERERRIEAEWRAKHPPKENEEKDFDPFFF